MCLKRLKTSAFGSSKPLLFLRLNKHVGAIPTYRVYQLYEKLLKCVAGPVHATVLCLGLLVATPSLLVRNDKVWLYMLAHVSSTKVCACGSRCAKTLKVQIRDRWQATSFNYSNCRDYAF